VRPALIRPHGAEINPPWVGFCVDKMGSGPDCWSSKAGTTVDFTLGLRPLGLSPGSQGRAAWLIAIFAFRKFAARTPTAAAAEIADARGPGVKSQTFVRTLMSRNSSHEILYISSLELAQERNS
jgi:hypothetical protein